MSNILVNIKRENLSQDELDEELYSAYVIEFVVGIKSLFAEYISTNYDVTYPIAMALVRIHEHPYSFEVGIDSPETYDGKARQIVVTILKNDLGSVTEKIAPLYRLKKASDELSSGIKSMWLGFVAVRERGEKLGK